MKTYRFPSLTSRYGYLNGSGKSVTSQRDNQKYFSNPDKAKDVKICLFLVVGLRRRSGLVLVHEERDANDDEKDKEVFQERVPFAAKQDAQEHDWNWLARFANDLKYKIVCF